MEILELNEVEYVAHRFAKEWMNWNEPIPDFRTRFPHILESCLVTPFQSFGGKPAYAGLAGKGSMLFYLMIKNHPFRNGNKRIAVATLLVILYKNKKWLDVDNQEFYNFAKWVAESSPKFREETISAIQKFIITNLVEL